MTLSHFYFFIIFLWIISSLEMLAGVSLAEEGILRFVFAVVYLSLNKGGNDNDVSSASRYDSFFAS